MSSSLDVVDGGCGWGGGGGMQIVAVVPTGGDDEIVVVVAVVATAVVVVAGDDNLTSCIEPEGSVVTIIPMLVGDDDEVSHSG